MCCRLCTDLHLLVATRHLPGPRKAQLAAIMALIAERVDALEEEWYA